MRRRTTALLLVSATAAAGSAAVATTSTATAPTRSLKIQNCVFTGTAKVPYLAQGLEPAARYVVKLGGEQVEEGAVRVDGTVFGSIAAPKLGRTPKERRSTLSVEAAGATVKKTFTTVKFGVGISPNVTGRSPKDRFSFRIFGFLPKGTIYVHYVLPNGRLKRTLPLGPPSGPCGSLVTTRRTLFPFSGTLRRGRWRLQFDKRRAYSPRTPAPRTSLVLPIN